MTTEEGSALDKVKRHAVTRNLLRFATIGCAALAVIFAVLLVLSWNDHVQLWWKTYQDWLLDAQIQVEEMGNKGYLIFTILFLFAFKAFIPLYPLSLVCAATGAVFPVYFAVPINILGITLQYTLKYAFGMRLGPGSVNNILQRSETIRLIMKTDDAGNPWLLTVFRLIPFFPVNPVSQLYGALGFKYWKFLLLSLLGYMPLLMSYTIVGRNVYNPLSAGFLLPLIVLSVLGAIVSYTIRALWFYTEKRRKRSNKK